MHMYNNKPSSPNHHLKEKIWSKKLFLYFTILGVLRKDLGVAQVPKWQIYLTQSLQTPLES